MPRRLGGEYRRVVFVHRQHEDGRLRQRGDISRVASVPLISGMRSTGSRPPRETIPEGSGSQWLSPSSSAPVHHVGTRATGQSRRGRSTGALEVLHRITSRDSRGYDGDAARLSRLLKRGPEHHGGCRSDVFAAAVTSAGHPRQRQAHEEIACSTAHSRVVSVRSSRWVVCFTHVRVDQP